MSVCGDNPGSGVVAGFKESSSAFRLCRHCNSMTTKDEMKLKVYINISYAHIYSFMKTLKSILCSATNLDIFDIVIYLRILYFIAITQLSMGSTGIVFLILCSIFMCVMRQCHQT